MPRKPQRPTPVMGWPTLIVSGYGPTLLASIGFGAVIPLIALRATELGANVGLAAFITSLQGLATLLFDLPAGTITERLGEKRAIISACLVDAALMVTLWATDNLWLLAVCVFVHGMTASIFGLARQSYLTDALPLQFRARGLSTLGGVFRIGGFIGPLAAAFIIARWSMSEAFIFAMVTSLLAALVTFFLPDLPSDQGSKGRAAGAEHESTFQVLKQHRNSLLTLGFGVLAIQLVRTSRQTIIPLWCQANGISPATTSLIYSLSMAFDVLLFFPGGLVMDKLGRWWVCVPSMVTMSLTFLLLPLTHSALAIGLVASLLGLGNGISSGIVMTLGADTAPRQGRTQYLAGFRLMADAGISVGPLVISAVSAVATLSAAALTVGALGLLGSAWLTKWVPMRREDIPKMSPDWVEPAE